MERSVVATRVGGPPEFVTPGAGLLVDPLDEQGLAEALERAAELPTPNPAAREAAAAHDVRVQVARMADRARAGGGRLRRSSGRAQRLRNRSIASLAETRALKAPTIAFSAGEPAGGIAPSWRASSVPFM